MKHTWVLGLGSNHTSGTELLQKAMAQLAEEAIDACFSAIYQTPDIKNPHAAPYFNAVGIVTIDADFETLNTRLKALELSYGRTPEARQRGEVALDVDIVCCDETVIREKDFGRAYFQIGWSELQTR